MKSAHKMRIPLVLQEKISTIPASKGVYYYKCVPTDTYYVGISSNMRYRLNQHFGNLERRTEKNRLKQVDYDMYGPENYEVGVLSDGTDYIQEEEWTIRIAKEHKVYNMVLGKQGNRRSRNNYNLSDKGRRMRELSNVYNRILRKYNDVEPTSIPADDIKRMYNAFTEYNQLKGVM